MFCPKCSKLIQLYCPSCGWRRETCMDTPNVAALLMIATMFLLIGFSIGLFFG